MIRTFFAAAAISCALAAPAFAGALTAQLQAPVAAPTQVIAGGAVWNCAGASCSTGSATDRTLDVGGCHELARAVGPVAAFGASFDAAQVAKCDKGVAGAAPVIAKASSAQVAAQVAAR